jgi:GNAT superfamily N-acetyltransferase
LYAAWADATARTTPEVDAGVRQRVLSSYAARARQPVFPAPYRWALGGLSIAVVAAVVLMVRAPAAPSFQVAGQLGQVDAWLDAPTTHEVAVRFSEGTLVSLGKSSRGRVTRLTRGGAEVSLSFQRRPVCMLLVSPDISFVQADEADFEELFTLRLEALREGLERLGRFDAERSRVRFRASFAPRFTRHVVVNGARIGFVAVKPHEEGLLLDHLYIRPAQQGFGIGAAVLGRVFADADAAGLALRVGALRDSAANRFYARHGFQKTAESAWDIYYLRPCREAAEIP